MTADQHPNHEDDHDPSPPAKPKRDRRKHQPENHIPQNQRQWQLTPKPRRQELTLQHMKNCIGEIGFTPSRYHWSYLRHDWPGFMPGVEALPHTFDANNWANMIAAMGLPRATKRVIQRDRDYPEPVYRPIYFHPLFLTYPDMVDEIPSHLVHVCRTCRKALDNAHTIGVQSS